mmetsp:Transcript_108334/g.149733  ORF Transcript_108334/g.149733 Transcript_108334/m.149733 type:complete len:125 (+) Transcript_108334:249-623(+)
MHGAVPVQPRQRGSTLPGVGAGLGAMVVADVGAEVVAGVGAGIGVGVGVGIGVGAREGTPNAFTIMSAQLRNSSPHPAPARAVLWLRPAREAFACNSEPGQLSLPHWVAHHAGASQPRAFKVLK